MFVRALPEDGGEVELSESAAAHVRVLRLAVGAPLVLFDGRGRSAPATLIALSPAVRAAAEPPTARIAGSGPRLVLAQAIPKGKKLDAIVRGCTEIGVSEVHLVEAERSVSRTSPERAVARIQRLGRIAREAARQCGRDDVPELVGPAPLTEVIARAPAEACRWRFEPEAERALAEVEVSNDIAWILVGPEGGWSDLERTLSDEAGFIGLVALRYVMRVETAACALSALSLARLSARA